MTVNRYAEQKMAAALMAAALALTPAAMLAAETAPQTPGTQAVQETTERLMPLGQAVAYHGVSVSKAWLRQAKLNGTLINLRLYTPMGDEVLFREWVKASTSDLDRICLYLLADNNGQAMTLQIDQIAMDVLARLGIDEVVVADTNRYVHARYQVSELQAVRDALGLGAAEQLCVSGEDAPVTVVSEDGVRRQVN